MNVPEPLTRPPWHFRFATFLRRNGLRGGDRLIATAARLGLLNHVVRYPVGDRHSLDVSLFRRDGQWDAAYLERYEAAFLDAMCAAASALRPPIQLVDCGADIGMFSVLACARFGGFGRILAFEPNPDSFPLLERNLGRLGVEVEARNAAVCDFSGRGALTSAESDRSDWAKFVVPDAGGSIVVERLDDVLGDAPSSLALKVDVEGAELNVLRGAARVLAEAPQVVVGFEAHREVFLRTGVDPVECVRFLQEIRPFRTVVAEAPGHAVDPGRPFFEQLRDRHVYNLVCSSAS